MYNWLVLRLKGYVVLNMTMHNVPIQQNIVVPWIVTGIAVLTFSNLLGIQGSMLSVIIGHILICLPFVILTVSTQLYEFDRSVEEAAKNLGAGELRTFYEVTLPLIAPDIIAGMFFAPGIRSRIPVNSSNAMVSHLCATASWTMAFEMRCR